MGRVNSVKRQPRCKSVVIFNPEIVQDHSVHMNNKTHHHFKTSETQIRILIRVDHQLKEITHKSYSNQIKTEYNNNYCTSQMIEIAYVYLEEERRGEAEEATWIT